MTLILAGCDAVPQAAPQRPARAALTYAPPPETRQCLANLGAREAEFTPLPDRYYGVGCSNIDTVRVASLQGDDSRLGLTNLGAITCPLAGTLAGWARYGVDRAARQILGSPLVRIETMGSYACRNVAGTDHRSAHATASAIDVAGFDLADGRRVTVLGNWASGTPHERAFLRVIEASACKRFGTVLGPDYNAAHHDHFHVELSGSAFCR